jgi:hypothetical protein
MIIQINETYRLVSNELQWTLQKRRKGGQQEKWEALGYYTHIDNAVLDLAKRRLRCIEGNYGPEALEPLCRALDAIREDIKKALVVCPHCGKLR